MNDLLRIYQRLPRRLWLIVLAVALLGLKLGSVGLDNYRDRATVLESSRAALTRYQTIVASAGELQSRLERLQRLDEQGRRRLFSGAGEDEIVSAMQLTLQSLFSAAGLQSESIRPVIRQAGGREEGGKNNKGGALGEVAVKAQLTGSMGQYLDGMARLARADKFFKIEGVTLNGYKKAGMKIYLELRGYYLIVPANTGGGPGRGPGKPAA